MELSKLKVNECDGDLSEALKQYTEHGNPEKYGALLILVVPASRQKNVTKHGMYPSPASLQGGSIKAAQLLNFPGVYVLSGQTENLSMEQWKQIKVEALKVKDEAPFDFMKTLSSGEPFEIQSMDDGDWNISQRMELGLKLWPFRRGDPALRLAAEKSNFPSLKHSTITIFGGGGPIKAFTPVANLHHVSYHQEGAPVRWIVVPPSQRQLFEWRLREAFNMQQSPPCSQFVTHLSTWIDPKVLKLWNIDFSEICQEAGQVLCLFPGAYAWGSCTGFGVLEQKHYSFKAWKLDNNSFCSMKTAGCQMVNPSGAPMRLSHEEIDEIEAASRGATWQPRKRKFLEAESQSFAGDNHNAIAAWRDDSTDKIRDAATRDRIRAANIERLYQGTLESQINPELPGEPTHHTAGPNEEEFYFSDGEEGLTFISPVSNNDVPRENVALLNNLQRLAGDRLYLYQRKELYKWRLSALEEQLSAINPEAPPMAAGDSNPWEIAALDAFQTLALREREILERDRRINELSKELQALKLKEVPE